MMTQEDHSVSSVCYFKILKVLFRVLHARGPWSQSPGVCRLHKLPMPRSFFTTPIACLAVHPSAPRCVATNFPGVSIDTVRQTIGQAGSTEGSPCTVISSTDLGKCASRNDISMLTELSAAVCKPGDVVGCCW